MINYLFLRVSIVDVFMNQECDSVLLYIYGTNRINLTLVYIFFPIRKISILIFTCQLFSRLVFLQIYEIKISLLKSFTDQKGFLSLDKVRRKRSDVRLNRKGSTVITK